MRALRRQRAEGFGLGALLTLVLLLASCSPGTDDSVERSSIDLTRVSLDDPLTVPYDDDFDNVVLVPPGESRARWIDLRDDEFCVTTVLESDPEQACAPMPVDVSFDRDSFASSPDGSRLYFTQNFFQNGQEPDIWSFEPATGSVLNITDDGTRDVSDDRAVLDFAPFVSEDGRVHFFNLGPDALDLELTTIDSDENAVPLPSVPLDGLIPVGAIHPIGHDRFVYRASMRDEQRLVLLDLGSGESSEVPLPQLDAPVVLASGRNTIVVAGVDPRASLSDLDFEVVDFAFGDTSADRSIDRHPLDLGLAPDVGIPAFGLSPDGTSVVALVPDPDSGEYEMVGAQRSEDGTFGEPRVVGAPGFLGQDADGEPNALVPAGRFRRVLWTRDDQLVIPATSGVLVFDLTSAGDEPG